MKKALIALVLLGGVGAGVYFGFFANQESQEDINAATDQGKEKASEYCQCISEKNACLTETKNNPETPKTCDEIEEKCAAIDKKEQQKLLKLIMNPQTKQQGLLGKEAWSKEKGKCVE